MTTISNLAIRDPRLFSSTGCLVEAPRRAVPVVGRGEPRSKVLVPAKSRFIAISIAPGVLRRIVILVSIFSPVTVISVVVLSARIGIENP